MKRIVITLVLVAAFFGVQAQTKNDLLWDQANTAYINADYDKAIALYDSIRMGGMDSYKLYYNLGNAHFKKGSIGASILNYNRALRLAPTDSDIKYNLHIANARVKDQIDAVPRFFLAEWIHQLQSLAGHTAWALISLAGLVVAFGALLVYLLSDNMLHRRVGFYTSAFGFMLFAFVVFVAERREVLNPNTAIVMSGAVAIKSSPDNTSKDIFVLHEGTKVKVLEQLNGWCEITIADGKKGWVIASSIEEI